MASRRPYSRAMFVALLLAGSTPAIAQRLDCVKPAGCTSPSRTSQEVIVVQLVGPDVAGSQTIYFHPSMGKMLFDTVRADAKGVAVGVWTGDQSNRQVRIMVGTVTGGTALTRQITLGAQGTLVRAVAPAPRWYHDWGLWSRDQQWYEKRQLRRPASVQIQVDSAHCAENAVLFSSHGKSSEVKPDTAFAQMYFRGGKPSCEANGFWLLGEGVGRNLLRATLLSDPEQRVELVAKSRAIPWFGLGLAYTSASKYVAMTTQEQTVKVVRRFQTSPGGDSLEVAYDSTVSVTGPKRVNYQNQLAPVIGVNFPLVLRAEWLRLYLGTDIKNPRSDWYVGVSLLQMTAGWQHESVGYDIDIVGHLSQRQVASDTLCLSAPATCKTTPKTGFVGLGLVATVSTAPLLEKVFTALGVK